MEFQNPRWCVTFVAAKLARLDYCWFQDLLKKLKNKNLEKILKILKISKSSAVKGIWSPLGMGSWWVEKITPSCVFWYLRLEKIKNRSGRCDLVASGNGPWRGQECAPSRCFWNLQFSICVRKSQKHQNPRWWWDSATCTKSSWQVRECQPSCVF